MAGAKEPQLPVSRETWAALAASLLAELDPSPEVIERLIRFEGLLRGVAVQRGFISPRDADRLFERHVLDSARAALGVREGDGRAVDAGSGAGLPGIPIAIARPQLEVTLVEPRQARIAFLELAVERLDLRNVRVTRGRVESLEAEAFDVAFARAFAPLHDAWARLRGALAPSGRLVFFAGSSTEIPLTLDGAVSIQVRRVPVLATSGPLIIIGRQ